MNTGLTGILYTQKAQSKWIERTKALLYATTIASLYHTVRVFGLILNVASLRSSTSLNRSEATARVHISRRVMTSSLTRLERNPGLLVARSLRAPEEC